MSGQVPRRSRALPPLHSAPAAYALVHLLHNTANSMFHVEHFDCHAPAPYRKVMGPYDVIVIGAGHAGCEAAAAAARRGATVLLLTSDIDRDVGAMSCNPAIGGIGKGHLVREVDVFNGVIARAADAAAIHYRMLNMSKGPAVWGPRVQADRQLFRRAVQTILRRQDGLTMRNGHVEALCISAGRVTGVLLAGGEKVGAKAVVLATGTFLSATLYRGLQRWSGGRIGGSSASGLAQQLRALDLPMARLKTGTPPRLDGRTIDWAKLDRQPSDGGDWTFSALTPARRAPQLACGIARTTPRVHDIIREAEDRSPVATGAIAGQGPRYCPSIEDKVRRFGDRDGHQIFLEPESLNGTLIYPNGISTSLPEDVQTAFVKTVPGLERAEIRQFGYAVEYDHLDPRALDASLALRALPGLFCAGQLNGTTGYEEAAAQGLVAGLNAAAEALRMPPVLFERSQSYIGVMIDDLTLQGITEPYRMLSSRAEFRLHLRADNAATRLGRQAIASGATGSVRRAWLEQRFVALEQARSGAAITDPSPNGDLAAEVAADALYAPYLKRQTGEVARLRSDAHVSLASITSYRAIGGLSKEMVERLEAARPPDLGAAGRIGGITPAALTAIMIAAERQRTAA